MTSLAPPPPTGDSGAPAAARPSGRAGPAAGRPGREQRQQGDQFDRLLRRKSEDSEALPDTQNEGGPVAGLLALAGWLPGTPPPALATTSAPPPPALPSQGGAQAAHAAQAVFEAAAQPQAAPSLLAPAVTTEATAWQVSLNDPAGLPVELRVTRPEGTGAETAPWNLTIAAGASNAAQLAQHAQRLGERLRTRAVALAHLRIESDEAPSHSD